MMAGVTLEPDWARSPWNLAAIQEPWALERLKMNAETWQAERGAGSQEASAYLDKLLPELCQDFQEEFRTRLFDKSGRIWNEAARLGDAEAICARLIANPHDEIQRLTDSGIDASKLAGFVGFELKDGWQAMLRRRDSRELIILCDDFGDEVLVEWIKPLIRKAIGGFTNLPDLEELEVSLQAFLLIDKRRQLVNLALDEHSNLVAWIFRVCKNKAKDLWDAITKARKRCGVELDDKETNVEVRDHRPNQARTLVCIMIAENLVLCSDGTQRICGWIKQGLDVEAKTREFEPGLSDTAIKARKSRALSELGKRMVAPERWEKFGEGEVREFNANLEHCLMYMGHLERESGEQGGKEVA